MADVKTIQTRLQLKYDTYANWTDENLGENKGANLVLLPGEIGICAIPAADAQNPNNGSSEATTNPTVLFKVGDGTTPFKTLKWASALAADVYAWAKSDTVSFNSANKKIEFKHGTDVVHDIDLSYFAAASTVADHTDRIADLEAALGLDDGTSEGSVSKQIADIVERLGVIQGADTVEGSIAKALKDAKAYTDEKLGTAAVGTEGTEGYVAATGIRKEIAEAQAAAVTTANGYTDSKVSEINSDISEAERRLGVIEGEAEGSIKKAVADAVTEVKAYADQAETDAVNAAKEYTNNAIGVKADGEAPATGIRKEIADAEAAAKAYTNSAVETIDAKDSAQDTAIQTNATAIADEKTAREQADQAINTKIGNVTEGKDVVTMISDAQAAAVAAAKTETEKQVKALADGQVETNRAAIAAMDTAYKAADEELDGRLDTVEAKLANVSNVMDFIGAREVSVVEGVIVVTPVDEETFNNGDVVVDSTGKEYVYDGSVWREFGYADANASAISDLLTRMDTAEDDIDQAQADIDALEEEIVKKLATETFNAHVNNDHAGTATEITAEIAEAVNGEKALREAADKAINDKIGTLPSDYATLVDGIAAAKKAGDDADAKAVAAGERLDVVEPKVATLQDIVDGYSTKGSIKTAVDAAAELAQKGVDDAKKAQDEVDALEEVVAGVKETADNAKADLAALTGEGGRLTVAESNIATLQSIVNSGEGKTIRDDVTALQTLTGDASKGNEALYTELGRVAGLVEDTDTGLAATKAIADEAKSDAEDAQSRVAAIEADYLKSTDLFIFNCGSSTTNVHEQPVEQPAE
jgi:hypothetical protein